MHNHILVTPDLDVKQEQAVKDILYSDQTSVNFLNAAPNVHRKEIIERADILMTLNPVNDLSDEEFDCLKKVRFIQLISAGADHLPYQKIPADILLASNPGAYAGPMAEHVLAMALSLAKRLREEDQNMRNGQFNQFETNRSIKDSTVGILGFGGIGQASARLFRAFGSRIFAMNTSGQTDEPVDFIGTTDDLEHILSSSDIVILSLPLNNQTRGLIGTEQLKWMRSDAILINVARGEIIHQKALYEHLKSHPKFKAGLESWWVEPIRHGDFKLEYPLLELSNILASPHNSSMVEGAKEHGIREAAVNIQRFLHGEPVKGEINRKNFM